MKNMIGLTLLLLLLLVGDRAIKDMEKADYAYFNEDGTFMVRDTWIRSSWAYRSEPAWTVPFHVARFYLVGKREIQEWNEYYDEFIAGTPVGGSVPSHKLHVGDD